MSENNEKVFKKLVDYEMTKLYDALPPEVKDNISNMSDIQWEAYRERIRLGGISGKTYPKVDLSDIVKDMLKMMDNIDRLEQMVINLDYKFNKIKEKNNGRREV